MWWGRLCVEIVVYLRQVGIADDVIVVFCFVAWPIVLVAFLPEKETDPKEGVRSRLSFARLEWRVDVRAT